MTLYEYLHEGDLNLDVLIRSGLVSCQVRRDMALLEYYHQRIKITGSNYELIADCSRKFKLSTRTVYSIIRTYQIEVIAAKI